MKTLTTAVNLMRNLRKSIHNTEITWQHDADLFDLSWSSALESPAFRRKLLFASILFVAILLCFPYFFAFIQKRQTGVVLNDWLLSILPSVNVSYYIFAIIYVTVSFGIFRAAQSPQLFLLFLWSSILVSLSRMGTITLVPLAPPVGLVPLVDPVLIPFYRHTEITKDLFYSGHTGSVFLIYLILRRKREKRFALAATVAVGILLLIQHIHYFIDVIFAPFFVYIVFILAKKITGFSFENEKE